MDAQLKRGLLDAYVLAAVSRESSYGYRIVHDAPPALELTESTLYPILRRLARDGLLLETKQEHNGRLRKYFSLTDRGRDELERFVGDIDEVEEILTFVRGRATR